MTTRHDSRPGSSGASEPPGLTERQRRILEAVVRAFVEQGEPVSSLWLAERGGFGLSSATVRHTLAQLEELGCIHQPHTSAGRVPTDKGYRAYVNQLLAARRPARPAPEIEARLRRAGTVEDMLQDATRELSRLSHHAGFALIAAGETAGFEHIDFHSKWSDGTSSIEEIAKAAQKRGYQYMAICDHSKSLRIAHGLDETRVLKQIEEIDRINEKLKGFHILKGTEVDILTDGKIDHPDKVLRRLDYVVAAVHSGFKQEKEKMTKRIVRALENPLVHCLAHPTGRLLGARAPYEVDLDEVMEAAKKYGKVLEINATFERLDLDDVHCKKAKEMGIRMAIGTDSHHPNQLWMISLGVGVARRGWLETPDLLNTLSLKNVEMVP